MLKAETSDRSPSGVLKSAATLASVAGAVIVAKVLQHYWKTEAFASLFFCAIMFSAWFGGYRHGLFAITLSVLAFDYCFLTPIHSIAVNLNELPRLTVFLLCALLIGFLAASQRNNTASLQRARDDLAAKVEDLKKINESLDSENAQRRLAEGALQRSKAYLAEAQRLSRTGSFGWQVSTGELFWSEETFRVFQFDPKTKPTVERVFQSVHPDDATLVKETIGRASQNGKDFDFEHRLLMPDGSVKHLHIVAHAERDELGEVEFVGAVMDVTVAKEAEEKIRLIINTVPGLLWTARPDGWVDFLNQRWLDYTGMTLEQGLGWAWQPGYHPDDLGNVLSKWRAAVAERKPLEVEARLRRSDGDYRWFLKRAFPLFDSAGRVLGWYGGNIDVHDLKQAEEKLRRIETYLSEGQRLSRTGSWAWSVKTKENLFWSREQYRIFGFDPDTESGRYGIARDRIHPADLRAFDEKLDRAIQGKKDFEIDFRIVLSGGEVKHVHNLGHPVLNNSGELVEYIGTTMDMTERKRAEETLRRSENYLAEAQKLTHAGSWAYNILTGELVHSSEEHRRLFGFDSEKGIPSFDELVLRIHPEDRTRALREFETANPSGKDFDAHFRIVLPDGTMKYVYGTGHPVFNLSGDVREFIGTVMDVTERKLAEEALRRSENYLAEAQRLSHTGSWARSSALTGETRYWSEECRRLLGYEPHDAPPSFETFLQRVHPDDQARFKEIAEKAGREKADYQMDYRLIHPSGEIRDIHTIGHPIFSPSGDLIEYVGTAMDVTERKRAEEALRRAQAELTHITRITTMGELTASIAHEVNQPLAAIVNNANACMSLMPDGAPDLAEVREALAEIIEDADRASNVISRVRQLAKRAPIEKSLMDLGDVVNDVLALARYESAARGITIRTDLPGDLPSISGDRVQLQQVLLNLVINGMDAMNTVEESKRVLFIRGHCETRNGRLETLASVQDAGIGFKAEEMGRLFEAFYTTKPQGMGMGLAISRTIIEAHGGRLWAEPNQGPGATFLFSLPASGNAAS